MALAYCGMYTAYCYLYTGWKMCAGVTEVAGETAGGTVDGVVDKFVETVVGVMSVLGVVVD